MLGSQDLNYAQKLKATVLNMSKTTFLTGGGVQLLSSQGNATVWGEKKNVIWFSFGREFSSLAGSMRLGCIALEISVRRKCMKCVKGHKVSEDVTSLIVRFAVMVG